MNTISFPNLGIAVNVPRAISIFGIDIYLYGIIIALGLCLAFVYASRESRRVGLSTDDLLNMFMLCVPVAIVCARLYYVIFSWEDYRGDLLSILNIRGGGLAIYGGVIGAVVTIFVYTRCKKLSFGLVLDVLAVGLLIGQAVGRWGNFVNGEAYGGVTGLPWAMTVTEDGTVTAAMVHPTFLYESLWNTVGIAVLSAYRRRRKFRGELFGMYMVWYGLGRVMIEGLRADSLMLGAFRVSQLLSALLLISGAAIILIGRKKNK